MNRRDLTYKLAINHLADHSNAELRMMRGYRTDKTLPRGEIYQPTVTDVPDSMDWWIKGVAVCVCVCVCGCVCVCVCVFISYL